MYVFCIFLYVLTLSLFLIVDIHVLLCTEETCVKNFVNILFLCLIWMLISDKTVQFECTVHKSLAKSLKFKNLSNPAII